MDTLDDDFIREGEPPRLPTEPRYYPVHPLFPLPEGVRETKEIAEISFDRWDHQGKKERCPDRFPAAELTSLAQVVDLFGGGTYQFIGFDTHGHFSKWTSEKDKIRVALPCKPFRPTEHENLPEAPPNRSPAPSPSNDFVPLLIAAQERADRMLAALLDRVANIQAPPPPPAPPPALDPMTMLTGLATVLEKLRPPQPSGDMIGQLSGLVGIAKQLGGKASPAAAEEDATLQPFLTMMTNAMAQKAAAPEPAPSAAPSPRSDLIWVDVPQIGPVMMRPEQAATVLARLAGQSAPPSPPQPVAPQPTTAAPSQQSSTPAPSPEPIASAATSPAFARCWDDVAARLQSPAEQRELKQAIERLIASSASSPSLASAAPAPPRVSRLLASAPAAPPTPPRAPAPAPVHAPPPALSPSAARTLEPPAPTATAPQAAAREPEPKAPVPPDPSGPKCLACGALGSPDPKQPNVLICRNNHRSLLAVPPPADEDGDAMIPLDSIPTEHIEAILADEETLRAMPGEMVASFRREAEARKANPRPPEQAS